MYVRVLMRMCVCVYVCMRTCVCVCQCMLRLGDSTIV